jgi:hypothetical protein
MAVGGTENGPDVGRNARMADGSLGKHAGSMREACGKHAGSMREACGKHAGSMREACGKRCDAGISTLSFAPLEDEPRREVATSTCPNDGFPHLLHLPWRRTLRLTETDIVRETCR